MGAGWVVSDLEKWKAHYLGVALRMQFPKVENINSCILLLMGVKLPVI